MGVTFLFVILIDFSEREVTIISMVSRQEKKGKVFVGLSGGVDSSVSAALLKRTGYDVVGVFIKAWVPDWLPCSWKDDRLDAMRVCAKLNIPFVTLNLEKEYKKEVVDYMIAEYRAGRTPNPDVMCNKRIKFGAFFDWAVKNGADFVATGHYSRIESERNETQNDNVKVKNGEKIYKLKISSDKEKDQSYFLWTLNQETLSRTIFPVGNMEKAEVRRLARKFGLPTADKKDSQGLCFIGKVDVKEFLERYIKPKRGDVLNERGEVIGFHDGAWFLTLGERHGFTVTKKGTSDRPLFVVGKDVKTNTVTVSPKSPEGALPIAKGEVMIKNIHWISDLGVKHLASEVGSPSRLGNKIFARVRYRQPLQLCQLGENRNIRGKLPFQSAPSPFSVRVTFDEPQVVAAGQSVVLYQDDECLGGGIAI